MAVNTRLLAASLGVAVVISVGAGYLVSRGSGDATTDIGTPGTYQVPSIAPNAKLTGTALPAASLQTSAGESISTASLLGRPMVINFWFAACAPCAQELPDLAAVHAEVGDRVRFVGVNPNDDPATNERFARDRGVRYELLLDRSFGLTNGVGIANFPVTLFVAADGTVLRQSGVVTAESLRAAITELFPR